MQVKKAVIPAAGLGTRFLPATKAQPKEMLPILDKPTLQLIIEEAVSSGITDILIITGRNKESIENHFDRNIELELHLEKKGKTEELQLVRDLSNMCNIFYVRQNTPLGLGHAINCAQPFVKNEPFAVLLGDEIIRSKIPVTKQLIDVYEKEGKSVIGVRKVKDEDVNKYGIVDPKFQNDNKLYEVKTLVEKPQLEDSPSNIAILGRYILTPSIFNILDNLNPGVGGEIQLTDGLKKLLESESILAYEFDGDRYDVGSKLGFLQATVETALARPEYREDFLNYLKIIVERCK